MLVLGPRGRRTLVGAVSTHTRSHSWDSRWSTSSPCWHDPEQKEYNSLDLGSIIEDFCNFYFEMFSSSLCLQLGIVLHWEVSCWPEAALLPYPKFCWHLAEVPVKKIIPALPCVSPCWILVSCKAPWVSHIQTHGTARAMLYIASGPAKEVAGTEREVDGEAKFPPPCNSLDSLYSSYNPFSSSVAGPAWRKSFKTVEHKRKQRMNRLGLTMQSTSKHS